MGRIPPEYLPPREAWPERVYTLQREVVLVDSVPRAPGPAGPGTGKLLRRVLCDTAV